MSHFHIKWVTAVQCKVQISWMLTHTRNLDFNFKHYHD